MGYMLWGMARGRELGIAWSLGEEEDVYDWEWQFTLRTEYFWAKSGESRRTTVNLQSS